MRNTVLLLTALILLGLGAYYTVKKQRAEKFSSGVTADRDFALPSLDGITNIVLTQAKFQPIQFQRKGNSWIINNKYLANDAVMSSMTEVLLKMKLRYTPPKAINKTIKEEIKRSGINVKIYAGGTVPIKSYYVASDAKNGEGTYILMDGAEQVYVMYLPAVNGGFRSRFEQPEERIRDIYIYRENPEEIVSVSVRYPKNESSSFVLTHTKDGYQVIPTLTNVDKKGARLNQLLAKKYVNGFSSLGAESYLKDYIYKDTLLKTLPYCIIEILNKKGVKSKNVFYKYEDLARRIKLGESNDETDASISRYFIWSGDKDLFLCQHRVFGTIFKSYDDFFIQSDVLKTLPKK